MPLQHSSPQIAVLGAASLCPDSPACCPQDEHWDGWFRWNVSQTVPQKHIRRGVIFHSTPPSLAGSGRGSALAAQTTVSSYRYQDSRKSGAPSASISLCCPESQCFHLLLSPGRFPGGLSTLEQVSEFIGDSKSCEP